MENRFWSIRGERLQKFFLLLPALVVVASLAIFPVGYSVINSFLNFSLLRPQDAKFIGLRNYVDFLSHPNSWNAFKVTLIISGFAVAFEFLIGLMLALVLAREFAGCRFLRTLLALPIMIAPLAASIIWRIIYDNSFGILNYVAGSMGFRTPLWLGDPKLAPFSIGLIDIWQTTPFMMLLLIAGLQSIPLELYEAAAVDGATGVKTFIHITLPSLKRAIMVALMFRVMDALCIFDTVFVLTGGGPGNATETLSVYCYKYGFRHFHMGFTSAATIVFFRYHCFHSLPFG
ncbi:MAG: sugar ABC transporter permease [Atribacterota bacterium]